MPPVFGPWSPSREALVVLRGRQRQHVPAVDHHDEARLLAGEELLDHHPRAGRAHRVADQHRVDRRVRLGRGRGDHHALARGEPVGLDHDRRALGVDVAVRRGGVGEGRVARGRDAVPRHEGLGVVLRALELRRRLRRAEDRQPRRPEGVDDARGQRRLGPDHGQRRVLAREGDEIRNRRQRDVGEPGLARGAGVARRDEHPGHPRGLRELPRQRVLAAAAADDEDVHAREQDGWRRGRRGPVSAGNGGRR